MAERFGTLPGRRKDDPATSNQHRPHNREIKRLRKKLAAARALRAAQRERKDQRELSRLGRACHRAVRALHNALRKRRKGLASSQAARARMDCSHSFWKFASRVLDEDDCGPPVSPSFNATCAEEHFKKVYQSQPHQFSCPAWLPDINPPETPFELDCIQPEELLSAICRANSTSAPSPIDQIPYQILKRCTSLHPALLDLYNHCWMTTTVPQAWRAANISLIPRKQQQMTHLTPLTSVRLLSPLVSGSCSHP